MTNIRAREVIHETLVYIFYPGSTNHPDGLTVFNQDIYTIDGSDGTVTAGSEAQSYIRLSVSKPVACDYLYIKAYDLTLY